MKKKPAKRPKTTQSAPTDHVHAGGQLLPVRGFPPTLGLSYVDAAIVRQWKENRFNAYAWPIDPPLVKAGKTFTWAVQRFKLSQDHKYESIGGIHFCEDKREAAEFGNCLKDRWREISRRLLVQPIKPIPILPGGRERIFKICTQATCMVKFLATEKTLHEKLRRELEVFPELADIDPSNGGMRIVEWGKSAKATDGQSYDQLGLRQTWQEADASFHSEPAMTTEPKLITWACVLRTYKSRVPDEKGRPCRWGVEVVELDEDNQLSRIFNRKLFLSETEAEGYIKKQCDSFAASLRSQSTRQGEVKFTPQDPRIKELKDLAAKTHDPKAKKTYEDRIKQEQEEKESAQRPALEKEARRARERKTHEDALQNEYRNNWPETSRVADEMMKASPEHLPGLKAELKRAVALDSFRIGCSVPPGVLDGELTPEFQSRLANASRAANPIDQTDREIVLNFQAKYAHLTPQEYTPVINAITGKELTAQTMYKRVRKWGFDSKRPEGRSPKT